MALNSARTAREEQMEREKNHRLNRTAASEREMLQKCDLIELGVWAVAYCGAHYAQSYV